MRSNRFTPDEEESLMKTYGPWVTNFALGLTMLSPIICFIAAFLIARLFS